MNKNNTTRSAAPRRGSMLLTGIMVGVVVGLAIAGGVAWYVLKTPNSFVSNVSHETTKLVADAKKQLSTSTAKNEQEPTSSAAISGVDDGKPRFEFYKVLTDKQDATERIQNNRDETVTKANKSAGKETEKAGNDTTKAIYFLQAGSFSNADDADRLKAKLAMLGIEASVQIAIIPDRGVWHRVHIGPYKDKEKMNIALSMLKQNGVSATPILAR